MRQPLGRGCTCGSWGLWEKAVGLGVGLSREGKQRSWLTARALWWGPTYGRLPGPGCG